MPTTPPKPMKKSPATASRCPRGDMAENAALLRTALDSTGDAFIAADGDGGIVIWNRHAEGLFGHTAADAVGQSLSGLLLPHGGDARQLLAADASAGQWRCRTRLRRRNGDEFDAELQMAAITLDGSRMTTLLVRDISDTLFAEQQLVQAQKLEAIGHLTGGLAHDFNNILGIIIGSLDLVAPSIDHQPENELLAAALSAAHRGADITRALLAVARRRALKPQPTEINELIDEIIPLLRQSAGKSIELSFSNNARNAVCSIDAGALNNALVNLVINARDAMPQGGQILIYTYTTDILPQALSAPLELKPGPYLVVGVDDNGAGMTPETAMRAFDPFFTTKERGRGTGLGLAMVYGFSRQSGGTARIQSAPGRGTSVQLLLPIAGVAVAKEQAKDSAQDLRGHARILLVDDEPTLLSVAAEWLKSLGHTVSCAADADAALAILAEHRFDLLLTDIVMPGSMNGLALVERCRGLYPEMAALVTTGFADGQAPALRTRAPVLDKPYTKGTLGRAVLEALADR